jgi:hypothetical protein
VYAHRHLLSHELVKYVIDPNSEPDVKLFAEALEILKRIRRFWTAIERDIGSFGDLGDVNLDDITPLSLTVLQMCIDAFLDGLPAD